MAHRSDAPAAAKIVQRLAEHETRTVPVIEKYSQLHGVVKVDGIGSFEEVFERASSVLESLFGAGWGRSSNLAFVVSESDSR